MSAYDIHSWVEFGVAVAGAAAVLTGLVFVSVSINLEKVLEVRGLPGRAGESVLIIGGLDDDYELHDFLSRADQPYRVLDEDGGRDVLERHGLRGDRLPVAVIDDETVLVEPSLEELGDALGVRQSPRRRDYDVVINTTQQIGGALGLAILAAVANGRTSELLERGSEPIGALTEGFQSALLIAAGFVVAAIVLAAVLAGGTRPAADDAAESVPVAA